MSALNIWNACGNLILMNEFLVPVLLILSTLLLSQADVDGNGTIDYLEFITATMHMNRVEKEEHLYKAFEYFDKDRSG